MEQAMMKDDSVDRFRTGGLTVLPTNEDHYSVVDKTKRFMTVEETSEQTGLSMFYLRQGIKTGRFPFIRCGNKAMINFPKLIEILDNESVNGKCR